MARESPDRHLIWTSVIAPQASNCLAPNYSWKLDQKLRKDTVKVLLNLGDIAIQERPKQVAFANFGLGVGVGTERPSLLIWVKKAILKTG
jgi:hypothetical protein